MKGAGLGQHPDEQQLGQPGRVSCAMDLIVPIALLVVMATSLGVIVVVSAREVARRADGRRRK